MPNESLGTAPVKHVVFYTSYPRNFNPLVEILHDYGLKPLWVSLSEQIKEARQNQTLQGAVFEVTHSDRSALPLLEELARTGFKNIVVFGPDYVASQELQKNFPNIKVVEGVLSMEHIDEINNRNPYP